MNLSRPAVVAAAVLATVGLTAAPAHATTISFTAQCDSGGLAISCIAYGFTGGTAPYTVTWSSRNIYTFVNPTVGSGSCTRGHPYSVLATVTDANHVTGTQVVSGACNPGPWQ